MSIETLEALTALIVMLVGPALLAAILAEVIGINPEKAARITLFASTLAPILALLFIAPPLP